MLRLLFGSQIAGEERSNVNRPYGVNVRPCPRIGIYIGSYLHFCAPPAQGKDESLLMREAEFNLRARQQVCAALDTTIGFLLCTSMAMLACFLFTGTAHSSWIPLFFVSVVSGVGVVYGAPGALAGLVSSAYVFACFLFYPIGEPLIVRAGARRSLEWMLGLGLFMVYVFGKRSHFRRKSRTRIVPRS